MRQCPCPTCAQQAAAADTPRSSSSGSTSFKASERGRIGLLEVDRAARRLSPGQPVQRAALLAARRAELVFTKGFMHELIVVAQRGGTALRAPGRRTLRARHAGQSLAAPPKPGVAEYELRARPPAPPFSTVAATSIFPHHRIDPNWPIRRWCSANPRPPRSASSRRGDIINMGARRPATNGPLRPDRLADHARAAARHGGVNSGTRSRCPAIARSSPRSNPATPPTNMRLASRFFSRAWRASRVPTQVARHRHCDRTKPHVFAEAHRGR